MTIIVWQWTVQQAPQVLWWDNACFDDRCVLFMATTDTQAHLARSFQVARELLLSKRRTRAPSPHVFSAEVTSPSRCNLERSISKEKRKTNQILNILYILRFT
jgi:hypothetical protein